MTSPNRVTRIAAPLRQQVADGLRDAIQAGEYAPGTRLVEGPLCVRFDVSRTVVREALRQLEAEGLVQVEANRGPVVVTLTEHDVASLYQVRGSLEGLAGALFATEATAGECAELRRRLGGLEEILPAGTLGDRLQAKDDFYDALLEGTHNEVLRHMVESIHGRTRLFRGFSLQAPGRIAESLAELRTITAAAAIARDAAAAKAACEQHIVRSGELAMQEFTRRSKAERA